MIDILAIARESGVSAEALTAYFKRCQKVWDINGAVITLRKNSMHIFAPDSVKKRWLTRQILKRCFREAFEITPIIHVSPENPKVVALVARAGFVDNKITQSQFEAKWGAL